MPTRRIHEHLDMLLFGKRYGWLHKWMDTPWRSMGKKHRRRRHDPIKTPLWVFILSGGDWKASLAAYSHIMLDMGQIDQNFVEVMYAISRIRKGKF